MSVYFYPYSHKNNFVSINQNFLRELGCTLLPVQGLFSFGAWRTRKKNTLVLNWVEDQMYRNGISKFHAVGFFFWFAAIALMGKVMASNIIWIRHNYQPHNATHTMIMHSIMCSLLARLSTRQICLEDYYGQEVLPHPLYLTDEQIKLNIAAVNASIAPCKFAFVGAIKAYKGIHKVLEHWPATQPMLITGRCDDIAYAKKLETIITRRNLKVECQYGYLSDHELESILQTYDYIVLAHDDNRMISSGTFYHAITYGCNLLCLPSKFTRAKELEHDFVHVFSAIEFTPYNIENLHLVDRKEVMQVALEHYSRVKIKNAWQVFLSEE